MIAEKVYGDADIIGPLLISSPLDIPSLNIPPEEMAMRLIVLEQQLEVLKCALQNALTREGKGDG